uniref:Uncharacterized protein n=1 Tax=Arundo donax TaxID=35708 RepID=A0A0A8ZBJ7_ARUDO
MLTCKTKTEKTRFTPNRNKRFMQI